MWSRSVRGIAVAGALVAGACSGDSTAPVVDTDSTVVLSVVPLGNATGVSPSSPVTITFSHPMMAGMDQLVMLHEGTVVGPVIPGTASWSLDRTSLTFVPAEILKSATMYVLHLSPNLRDATGGGINYADCPRNLGGQSVPPGMTGGRMGGGNGPGMMGPGWQAGTGTWGYGMTFTFTTA
jgi:Big-like domain-containing protein